MARAEWDRVAPQLHALRCLTELDVSVFAGYCWAYGVWHDVVVAMNKLEAQDPAFAGLLLKGEDGRRCGSSGTRPI